MPANNTSWLVHYWAGDFSRLGTWRLERRARHYRRYKALEFGASPAPKVGWRWLAKQTKVNRKKVSKSSLPSPVFFGANGEIREAH